jgi:hypothetical protein
MRCWQVKKPDTHFQQAFVIPEVSVIPDIFVIPANAGIQAAAEKLDTRFRGNDGKGS